MGFSYTELLNLFRKGLRNGSWRRLDRLEKAFYRATLWYAKVKGEILSSRIISMLLGIAEKLRETLSVRIFRVGLDRAEKMAEALEAGVYNWCPSLRVWLREPSYVFWLGLDRLSARQVCLVGFKG
jgi:hypothetical protein